MRSTLAGAAALAILAASYGMVLPAQAQMSGPPGTGITGGTTGQGTSGLQQSPMRAVPDATTRTAPRAHSSRQARHHQAHRASSSGHRQAAARARPTDPRDRAYMDGGMVGGTSDSMSGGGMSGSGMSGTAGQGMSGMQQSPMGGSSLGGTMGGGAMGRAGSTMGSGPGMTGGIGSGNQPGTSGTSQGR